MKESDVSKHEAAMTRCASEVTGVIEAYFPELIVSVVSAQANRARAMTKAIESIAKHEYRHIV